MDITNNNGSRKKKLQGKKNSKPHKTPRNINLTIPVRCTQEVVPYTSLAFIYSDPIHKFRKGFHLFCENDDNVSSGGKNGTETNEELSWVVSASQKEWFFGIGIWYIPGIGRRKRWFSNCSKIVKTKNELIEEPFITTYCGGNFFFRNELVHFFSFYFIVWFLGLGLFICFAFLETIEICELNQNKKKEVNLGRKINGLHWK